jgi:ATP-dependent DNA helicase RecG
LLGKSESEHYIQPAQIKVSWFLRDEKNNDIDYQHFGAPLLLSIDGIYGKIRNLRYRFMPNNTLFPAELTKYGSNLI